MDKKPRKRTLITVGQKLKVLEKLDRGEAVAKVALDFGFGITTVRDIKNQRWKLLGNARPPNRKSLRKSHSHFAGLEELLYWWLQKRQAEGVSVSGTMIMKQALEFHRILGIKDKFVASPGWLCRFKQRHGKREMGQSRGKAAVKLRRDFSPSSTSKLSKAVLKECWLEEPQFQHFRPDSQSKYVAYCTVCFKTVKLNNKGRRALTRHVQSKVHKERLHLQEGNYTVHIYRDEDEKPTIKQLWEDDDPLMVPVEAATRSHVRVRNCYSEEMTAPAADAENVDAGVPLQFEVINIPNLEQGRDLPVETNGLEPIATAEKSICRLCIKNEGRVSIFQDDGHVRVLALQIMALSHVKVSSSDGLPSHICSECVAMVHSCFNFKVQCETSDAMLRATLVTPPAAIQDVGDDKNCNIAIISNQLNANRDKIDTLVSSMRDLQQQYDRLHKSPAPAPVVSTATTPSVSGAAPSVSAPAPAVPAAAQPASALLPAAVVLPVSAPAPSAHLGAGSAAEHKYFWPCEVVDISDDEDSAQDYPEFKGFSLEKRVLGDCDVQRKVSQSQGGVDRFLDLPHYYTVELDDDSYSERKFDPVDLIQT